jgi:hypothetical protein
MMVKKGLTPVRAPQHTFLIAPKGLNYNWEDRIGTIEKGKFADTIAVSGNPLTDITEMERRQVRHEGRILASCRVSEVRSHNRLILSRIASALAVQTNGFGFSL